MLTVTAPYGTTPAVIRTLETYRETGLGGLPISVTVIGRFGYEHEVARRVVLSFKLLELIDDEGVPTQTMVAFKKASSADYKQVLADHLYDVYSTVFAFTGKDIASKSPSEIEDAFRDFKPDSLRKRMVSLFLGLCEYTGIVTEPPRSKPGRKASGDRPATRKPVQPKPPKLPKPPASDTDAYTVDLKSGGQITLGVANVNLFALTTDDRKFVIDMIDAMKAYGNRPELLPGPADA